jgi:hypothetical protein
MTNGFRATLLHPRYLRAARYSLVECAFYTRGAPHIPISEDGFHYWHLLSEPRVRWSGAPGRFPFLGLQPRSPLLDLRYEEKRTRPQKPLQAARFYRLVQGMLGPTLTPIYAAKITYERARVTDGESYVKQA